MRHTNPHFTAAAPVRGPLLGIWAHPDDETYCSAGLMATARAAGRRVAVVTATLGEAGGAAPGTRARELTRALGALGVTEWSTLGFADGACADLAPTEALERLQPIVDALRPETIVTFGPDGITGHADHRAVSSWVGALDTEAQVLHATRTPEWHEEWAPVNDALGIWMPGHEPQPTPLSEVALTVECNGALGAAKLAALQAHRSQTDGLVSALGAERYARWWATEWFVDARRGALSRPTLAAA
jgi:LmbE family N-acetylglucosaminyl deacetylase